MSVEIECDRSGEGGGGCCERTSGGPGGTVRGDGLVEVERHEQSDGRGGDGRVVERCG